MAGMTAAAGVNEPPSPSVSRWVETHSYRDLEHPIIVTYMSPSSAGHVTGYNIKVVVYDKRVVPALKNTYPGDYVSVSQGHVAINIFGRAQVVFEGENRIDVEINPAD